MKKLQAFNALRLPAYANLDRSSGRCRVSSASLKAGFFKGARTGSVAKIKLEGILQQGGSITALCTVWPDTLGCLEEGCISLDLSSITLSKVSHLVTYDELVDWTEATCEVIEISELKPISSLWYKSDEKLDISAFLGLAVAKDTRLHPFQSSDLVSCTRVNPPFVGVVASNTILIQDQSSQAANLTGATVNSPTSPIAGTAVIEQIIRRTLLPLVAGIPAQCRTNGILLLGPPGVGKTYALKAVQALCHTICSIRLMEISIPDLLAEHSPIQFLEERLQQASVPPTVDSRTPAICYVLLDELDALGREQKQSWAQMAIKQVIGDWLDHQCNGSASYACCLIGTTNRSDDIDASLRRGRRFEVEINVLSTSTDRYRLLAAFLSPLIASTAVSEETARRIVHQLAEEMAERAGGYVAADLMAVAREVPSLVVLPASTAKDEDSVLCAYREAILRAMRAVPPSCLRGLSLTLPRLSFDDVIGNREAKAALRKVFTFFQPHMREKLARFGLDQALGGVLLYGPPGNSKTRLVVAAASTYGLPMLSLSSADIYSAYLGDAEAAVRKAFTIARQAAPCVLFFDELDSLVTHRSHTASSAHSTEARVLATFLNEMDGVTGAAGQRGVIVMGATNRVDCIDPALIRKGRFYQTIHVPPPSAQDQRDLVDYFLDKCGLQALRDEVVGQLWEGMSGAEVENLVKLAALKSQQT